MKVSLKLKVLLAAVRFMLLCVVMITIFGGQYAAAQVDPGIRGGSGYAGQSFQNGLTQPQSDFFKDPGKSQFTQVEAVPDGLGPRFNLDSCAGCHIFPAVGGSSPPGYYINPDDPDQIMGNPQVGRLSIMAPGNKIPSFLTQNGPVREVRFVRYPTGALDGGVHAIFTISGRSDKPDGCAIPQPDFSYAPNLVFRIPTPVFGAGLIETITDTTIRTNLVSGPFAAMKSVFGITGHVNTNGNDGTVTRFGWKAQNKSLLIFSGEAYNVEMGITNENFPQEREEDAKCATNGLAENHTGFDSGNDPADIVAFMGFMRFLDQPQPACTVNVNCSASINNGSALFQNIGCAACHTPSLTTGRSPVAALNQQKANLFSDLAVHHMGTGLADNVSQGNAGGDEFRTAPLWGVGQRAFFLHDGRAVNLIDAINAHNSPGSEASKVIQNLQTHPASDMQDLLNFLRSL
jgi:CxxC motif-containing protein (DUF1111 family)